MRNNLTIILFLFQFILLTNCYAQIKEVVFTNKKTHLQKVYRLPHRAEISLIDDKPNFFSKVILDSVSNDTFYVSNPKNAMQKLAVPFNVVKGINIAERSFIRGFMGFTLTFLSIYIIGSTIYERVNMSELVITSFLFGGVGFTEGIVSNKKYNTSNFEVKGRSR